MNLSKNLKTGLYFLSLLLVPFIAQFASSEVNWSSSDFLIFGIMLFGTGFLVQLFWNTNFRYKILLVLLTLLAFLFIWAELAVGLVGSPWAGS